VLIYIHGFNSSPASVKAGMLRAALAQRGAEDSFRCPALPYRPTQAMALLESQLQGGDPASATLVGSSLGGFYATYLVEKYACKGVLLNPAITPHLGLRAYLGKQKNLYTGEEYLLEEEHLRELDALYMPRIKPSSSYLLVTETGDELLDYRDGVLKYPHARQIVIEGGDHGMSDFARYVDTVLEFARLP
jgi:uncharacterized protein